MKKKKAISETQPARPISITWTWVYETSFFFTSIHFALQNRSILYRNLDPVFSLCPTVPLSPCLPGIWKKFRNWKGWIGLVWFLFFNSVLDLGVFFMFSGVFHDKRNKRNPVIKHIEVASTSRYDRNPP